MKGANPNTGCEIPYKTRFVPENTQKNRVNIDRKDLSFHSIARLQLRYIGTVPYRDTKILA